MLASVLMLQNLQPVATFLTIVNPAEVREFLKMPQQELYTLVDPVQVFPDRCQIIPHFRVIFKLQ